jgi:hypothetical protein
LQRRSRGEKKEKEKSKRQLGTNQIDNLQEPHDDFTRSPSFQNFQDCKHPVRRDQLTLHLGSLGQDAQLFLGIPSASGITQVNE